jgi:succinate dehydrogenase/fumarate reductase flavoprotein subunit
MRNDGRPKESRLIGRRAGGWLVSVIALVGLVWAGVAAGAAPTIERITVNESSEDVFLTEECGVPVTTTAQGHVIVRTFSGEGTGVAQVNTISIGLTATAGDRTFRFRDVGADVVQIEPDGTLVLLITGQVPFAFAGVLKIDPETEEVILEPRDRSEQQLAKACTALTGA